MENLYQQLREDLRGSFGLLKVGARLNVWWELKNFKQWFWKRRQFIIYFNFRHLKRLHFKNWAVMRSFFLTLWTYISTCIWKQRYHTNIWGINSFNFTSKYQNYSILVWRLCAELTSLCEYWSSLGRPGSQLLLKLWVWVAVTALLQLFEWQSQPWDGCEEQEDGGEPGWQGGEGAAGLARHGGRQDVLLPTTVSLCLNDDHVLLWEAELVVCCEGDLVVSILEL